MAMVIASSSALLRSPFHSLVRQRDEQILHARRRLACPGLVCAGEARLRRREAVPEEIRFARLGVICTEADDLLEIEYFADVVRCRAQQDGACIDAQARPSAVDGLDQRGRDVVDQQ
jgi:hypothetical protein